MLWAKSVKACDMWQNVWDNDYFFEIGLPGIDGLNPIGSQIATWDMSFHTDIVRMGLVAMGSPNDANAGDFEKLALWANPLIPMTGRRSVGIVKPFRWALLNGYYYSSGRVTHKSYRFSVGEENVLIQENGRVGFIIDSYLRNTQWVELEVGCPALIGMERVGRGSSMTGGAVIYSAPRRYMFTGISLQNAGRRAYARRIKKVVQYYDQICGILVAMMTQWQLMAGEVHVGYTGFWPNQIKDNAQAVLSTFELIDQLTKNITEEKLEGGQEIGTSYISPSGPTLSTLAGKAAQLKEKATVATEAVGKILPFLAGDGEYYFTEENALKIWDLAKVVYQWGAPFAFFDPSGTLCEGAGEKDRVGGYIPGFPDMGS